MSAAVSRVSPDPGPGRTAPDVDGTPEPTSAVVVRRNAALSALIGAAASAIAIAYLWRAVGSTDPFDWALCALMAVVATFYLAALVDARTPLVVADDLGVRVRLGHQWRGLPWEAVEEVVVQPRRGLVKDGRLVFVPDSLATALEGLDARGRRAAALNQRLYGAALAVPMGLSTRVSARGTGLAEDLAALSHGRADVVVGVVGREGQPTEGAGRSQADTPSVAAGDTAARDPERSGERESSSTTPRRGLRAVVSRVRIREAEEDPDPQATGDVPGRGGSGRSVPSGRARLGASGGSETHMALLRGERRVVRGPHRLLTRAPGGTAVDAPTDTGRSDSTGDRSADVPEADVEGVWVRPLATVSSPVVPQPRGAVVTGPADVPVIGPELAAARARVGLSVDELAERTRIRPHVIESIELDDFGPCGGDFYARGHLRTLARVLGRSPEPLLRAFDDRYASEPIDARRVFEAELATGMTGSMRSTTGGPSWALMIAVVLVLALTWGVVRLFASEPTEQLQSPVPVLNGSAGPVGPVGPRGSTAPAPAPTPVQVRLVGAQDGSFVIVRDRAGTIVWAGEVALGEQRTLDVTPPVRVRAETGGVVTVAVDGIDRGVLGQPGSAAGRLFHRDPALDDGSAAGPGTAPSPSAG